MDAASASLRVGENLVEELKGSGPGSRNGAETMGRLKRVGYSHQAMIDLIIEKPWLNQNDIAKHFGYTPGWVSNVLASDAFQNAFASRKNEVVDPAIKASIEERFRALVIQSLNRLQGLLEKDDCPPNVALRAAELGAKALGVGGHAPPPPPPSDGLAKLAERLINLNNPALQGPNERSVDGQVLEVTTDPQPSA